VEKPAEADSGRTLALIDTFLQSMPEQDEDTKKKRKPTSADATIDYVTYLLQSQSEADDDSRSEMPQMRGQGLIDNFINNDNGKMELKENLEYHPQNLEEGENNEINEDEGYFTETLAKIYIKQGRYSKALEIIQRLSLNYPKKNAYFADQIRFLEKLIINNKNK
jgi:predicted Zn-dependent protease